MINKLTIKKILLASLATLVLSASQVTAAKQGHLKVTNKVQKMSIVTVNGKQSYTFQAAEKVLPGELVQYNTYIENISNEPTEDIFIVSPISKNLVYLPNSAQGKNTNVLFSVDGGKHYGKAGTLKVRGSDGKLYPAKPSNYTHIKWQYLGSLAPKSKQAVAFRARLR